MAYFIHTPGGAREREMEKVLERASSVRFEKNGKMKGKHELAVKEKGGKK